MRPRTRSSPTTLDSKPHARPAFRRAALLGLVVLLVGGDQLAKSLAKGALEGHPSVVVARDLLTLGYAENHGIAFSMLGPMPIAVPMLTALTLAVVMLVLVGWQRLPHKRPFDNVGFAMVAAGATGNLINTASVSTVVGDPNPGDRNRKQHSEGHHHDPPLACCLGLGTLRGLWYRDRRNGTPRQSLMLINYLFVSSRFQDLSSRSFPFRQNTGF